MAWNETTREQHKRSSDRFETDLTDEERELIEPHLPPPSATSTLLQELFNVTQIGN